MQGKLHNLLQIDSPNAANSGFPFSVPFKLLQIYELCSQNNPKVEIFRNNEVEMEDKLFLLLLLFLKAKSRFKIDKPVNLLS